MSAEERCFGHESVKRKPRTDVGIAWSQTCQSCHGKSTTKFTLSTDQKDTCELREKRICTLHTLPLVDLISAAPSHQMLLFKQPTPHFSGLNLVIFFFTALMIWNIKFTYSLTFFKLSASQSYTIYCWWLNLERMLRHLLRINNAFESHSMYELLGRI